MALSQYVYNDPLFSQIERAMDRAMDRFVSGRDMGMGPVIPGFAHAVGSSGHPMDIMETKDGFEITTDAPGFNPQDIMVEMHEVGGTAALQLCPAGFCVTTVC
jgi:HSP20 family molecular chaperone IbpA